LASILEKYERWPVYKGGGQHFREGTERGIASILEKELRRGYPIQSNPIQSREGTARGMVSIVDSELREGMVSIAERE
jgi:hypothetical protein